MGYLATSTLHPDLREPAQQRALAQHWRDGGALRLGPVLEPGLAAELAVMCRALPMVPRQVPAHDEVSWACDVQVTHPPDPQHGEAIVRLVRFLTVDMPSLVSTITGRAVTPTSSGEVHVWSLRKGSFVDHGLPLAAPGGLDVHLGLTAGAWPQAWGGHMVWRSERGELYGLPPAFDALDILDGGLFQVPLLTRHVQTLTVRSALNPAVST